MVSIVCLLLASAVLAAESTAPAAPVPSVPPPHGTVAKPREEAPPSRMTVVYLVLLKKGPAWTAEATPETTALQEAHMANIRSLSNQKKLIVAGPLGDNGDIRGIFLFQVGSLEAAKALTDSDPAIRAGRLVAEIHPWWVERGALPEAGTTCAPPPGSPPSEAH